MPDKYLLRPIVDPSNQPVLIALDIKNCALSEYIGARPCDSYSARLFQAAFLAMRYHASKLALASAWAPAACLSFFRLIIRTCAFLMSSHSAKIV
jgi:hypothetical protein